jgi:hypothetical protein
MPQGGPQPVCGHYSSSDARGSLRGTEHAKIALHKLRRFALRRRRRSGIHFPTLADRAVKLRVTWPLSRLTSSYLDRLRSIEWNPHQPKNCPSRGVSMKKTTSVFFVAAMLLGLEIAHAKDKRSTVPSKILSARTIFVDNQTNDAEFQHVAYMGLNKWGRFEIVDSPQKADLVLRLSGSSVVKFVPGGDASATYDPKPASGNAAEGEELAPPGCTKIVLIDPKSGTALWSEVRKTSSPQEKSRLIEGLHDAVDQQEKTHGK